MLCINTENSILDIELREDEAILIPTNGVITKDKRNVMGAGLAKEFKLKYPGIDLEIGRLINLFGNHVFLLDKEIDVLDKKYYSFPTKEDWRDKSEIKIIKQSCNELISICKERKIYLPKLGCGCGGLNWDKEVKPVLDDILDDRFIYVNYNK